jgi:hypothetical protein
MAKSANKHNRLYGRSNPLDSAVTLLIDNGLSAGQDLKLFGQKLVE